MTRVQKAQYVSTVVAIALIYFFSAKFGLSLAFTTKQVTTIWPPTGIGIAALLLLGRCVWPGIAIGAFFANVITNEPVWVALIIAVGNTLEAVVAVYLLKRFRFDNRLERAQYIIS